MAPVAYLHSEAVPALRFALAGSPVSVGRAPDNKVCLAQLPGSDGVSRFHALMEWDEQRQRWIVVDLNSTNGVYVDGRRTGENVLRDGGRVAFGRVEFVFRETFNDGQS